MPKKTQRKEKAATKKTLDDSKETALKKEEKLILQLKDRFEAYRKNLAKEKITQLTVEEWQSFEEYALNNKMFTTSFMSKGLIDKEKAKNSMLMSAFIGLKLKEFNAHFKEWAFANYGYQINEVKGKLRIIVEQKRMFD